MRNIKLIFPLVFAAILFAGCHPDKFEAIGSPVDVVPSLVGTWKLTKATQKDEESARKGFPYAELDLTTLFPYTDMTLQLVANDNSSPTGFVFTPGNSPQIIDFTTGQWNVDDGKLPTSIIFKNGTTTQKVLLGAYPVGSNKKLQFKVERRDADPASNNKLLISYTYEFTKQ